jgi:Flp pilus assembly pilin Flp
MFKREVGQGLVEYGLILPAIVLIVLIILKVIFA